VIVKEIEVRNEIIQSEFLVKHGVELWIKREDLIHAEISGNKWRKLMYNLQKAKNEKRDTILTFGGAASNHIAATAAAGKEFGFKTIGVIRGGELETETTRYASENGMLLCYISRDEYKTKDQPTLLTKLAAKFGLFYAIPEGGDNELGVRGCEDIITEKDHRFDIVCCGVGTGTTLSGIVRSLKQNQRAIGFSALKGTDNLTDHVARLTNRNNFKISFDYHLGGIAKNNAELVEFIQKFKQEHSIQLDPLYTGKMMFGIYDMVANGSLKAGTKILAIHTGGLQGIKPFEDRYGIVL